jgi:hypothetical protein
MDLGGARGQDRGWSGANPTDSWGIRPRAVIPYLLTYFFRSNFEIAAIVARVRRVRDERHWRTECASTEKPGDRARRPRRITSARVCEVVGTNRHQTDDSSSSLRDSHLVPAIRRGLLVSSTFARGMCPIRVRHPSLLV